MQSMQMSADHRDGQGIVVTSRPKELNDVVRGLAAQVQQKTAELKTLAVSALDFRSKAIIIAVDLDDAASQAIRDADRAMAQEPQLDFQRPS